jgi:hypothetical protein
MTKKGARRAATVAVGLVALAFIVSSAWQITVAVFGTRLP